MCRSLLFAGGAVLLTAVACWLVFRPSFSSAQQPRPKEDGPKSAQLAIGQVVLFSSGVGYFQREGTVEGDEYDRLLMYEAETCMLQGRPRKTPRGSCQCQRRSSTARKTA